MFSHYGVSEREGGRDGERERGEGSRGERQERGERERRRMEGEKKEDRKERDTFIYICMTECFMACF